ncbi:MAG: hypothetical protein ACU0FH_12810 [Heliomarina sp.]|uniref:hypothetical protein n=1 Tax=Heliomarina sp. TaxID=2917556 RepID=UPI0040587DDB
MAWNKKVFDSWEQLYWSPRKLGLHSVQSTPNSDGSGYVVPSQDVPKNPRFYTRPFTSEEWRAGLNRDEELLNQVIEIGLGIAPDTFLSKAFFKPFGIETDGPIEVIGREVVARHSELAPNQYTQHDGFYVAPDAVVAMEMKLLARTSMEQLLKYCTQIALEEALYGSKANVALLYIVPKKSVARTRKDLSLDDPPEHARSWEKIFTDTDKSRLRKLLEVHAAKVRDVHDRLQLKIATWDDFLSTITETRDEAIESNDQTLSNLMTGLIAQITATPGCGLATT